MSAYDSNPLSPDPILANAGMSSESIDLPLADAYELDDPHATIPIVMPLARELVPVIYPKEIECWRCGWHGVPDFGRCTRCDARVHRPQPRRRRRPSFGTGGPSRLALVLISYGLILLVTIIWAAVMVIGGTSESESDMLDGLAVAELVDAALVLVTLLLVGRVGLNDAPKGSWPAAWALAGPVLFALICGNLLFSAFLRTLFNVPLLPGPGVTLATILLICLQPAIVEELFFRHIALGALRREMSLRATILVTSVMFAVAHIGNPLGMPYLFVVGVAFGYARVYGGLPLSMLMHFLHNLAVISIDTV